MRIFTYGLTSGELKLNNEDGVAFISIEPSANSTCTLTGNMTFKGMTSTPIVLFETAVVNYRAFSPSSPLKGITVTWVSGTINLIIGF